MHRRLFQLDFVCSFVYLHPKLHAAEGSDLPCIKAGLLAANDKMFPAQPRNRLEPSFMVPFQRDRMFVGREDIIAAINKRHEQAATASHTRAALVGMGGVG